eukprot:375176_1
MIETNGMESCIIDCVSCILAQILCHLSKSMDSMQSYKLFQSVYDFAVFNLSVFQCVLIRNDTMPFVLLIIKDGNSSNYLCAFIRCPSFYRNIANAFMID